MDGSSETRRLFKKAVQQGRSERRAEAYPLGYVEDLSDARTMLAGFFSILVEEVATENQVRTTEEETKPEALLTATVLRRTRSGSC